MAHVHANKLQAQNKLNSNVMLNLFVCLYSPQGASRAESHYAGPLSADGADAAVPSVAALLQGDGGGEEPCAHVSVRRDCGGEGGGSVRRKGGRG